MVHFLQPYSPDLNPAEEVFSKIKYFLQQNDEVIEGATEEEFDDFILQVFCTITADDGGPLLASMPTGAIEVQCIFPPLNAYRTFFP